MNFLRLLIVVILVTGCGGLFGAAVGTLMGWAAPETLLGGTFGLWHADPTQAQPIKGAAAGGVYGLVAGAVIAIGIGVLDQVLLVAKEWMQHKVKPNGRHQE